MIEQSAYDSLAKKLGSLDLTTDEAAVLDGLVAAAAAAEPTEVSGHQLQAGLPTFNFRGVKCDVHPWISIGSAKPGGLNVVINHEEQ
jgi:hypothetical protein